MTRRKLTKARAEADELRRQLAEMQAALENLTPGGSEFAGSFAVCLNWIRTRLATTGHVAAERNELRRQLAEAQAAIAAVPRPEIAELCDLIDNSTTAISLDCPAGWAVREWLETYDAADLRRQFEQERVEIGMLRRQLQEGEQSALSHAIGQIFYLRRQLAEERMRANAAEFAVAQQRDEAADLRRQIEHANRWRDNEILAANEARAEAADLRRQLAEAQAEIAAFVAMRAAANATIAEAADLRRQVDKLREQLLEAAFIPRFMK